MLPAHERLDPDDLLGREIDDRLVVEPQLIAIEGVSQVGLEVEALDRLDRHRRIEQRHPSTARPDLGLRPLEGDLGVTEGIACRSAARADDDDPHPGGDVRLLVAEVERTPQRRREPVGDGECLVRRRHAVDEEPVLVAAEPGDGVPGPKRVGKPSPDRGEQVVASGVTEALVDDLEAVEVEQDEGARSAAGRRTRERRGEALGQDVAVRETRDPVGPSGMGEAFLECPLGSQVADRRDAGRSVGIRDRPAHHEDRERLAVGGQGHDLVGVVRMLLGVISEERRRVRAP